MISKHEMKQGNNNMMRVTFVMTPIDDCACLYLVMRKFGEWAERVYCMECADNGTWSLMLELEPAGEYVYRFRTDKGVWHDPAAHGSLPDFNHSNNPMMPI